MTARLSKLTADQILKKYWGHDSFRPLQKDIIHSVLTGNDSLALLPTGGGKSLCYQVPALMKEGLCLVISPLLSLMSDQVDQLKSKGIKAMAINSFMNHQQIDHALDSAAYGSFKLLYISPERLQTELFMERFKKMKVSFIAVDEAHCISQWGYDFRPSYLQIGELRALVPDIPILALTATATTEVVEDIMNHLEFREKKVFRKSYARENLSISILKKEDKRSFLVKKLKGLNGSSIVYARNRKRCRELAEFLETEGIQASYYHAGLSHKERQERQSVWAGAGNRCMVATNAFGMGIDKADVRCVIHVDLPDSLEAYYQEAGRAGRDGLESDAITLYGDADIRRLKENFARTFPEKKSIRTIYDKICNHFQISLNEGRDASFALDLGLFCEKYEFKRSLVYQSLKQLQSAGLLDLSEGLIQPSRVMISSSPGQARNPENESLQRIMNYLLRSFSGIMEEASVIEESSMARHLKISREELVRQLEFLDKASYIHYQASHDLPCLTFLSDRLPADQIQLGTSFERRKKSGEDRMNAVLDFIGNTETCRMLIILRYFGQEESESCGKCDVCTGMHRQFNRSEKEEIMEEILQKLRDKGRLNIRNLSEEFPNKPETLLLGLCRELLDKNLLALKGDFIVNLKP